MNQPTLIYTASRTHHAPKWRRLREALAELPCAPFEVCARWLDHETPVTNPVPLADTCFTDVLSCDLFLLYCEPDDNLSGSLVELGAALIARKPVNIVGDCRNLSDIFTHHPLVLRCETVSQALGYWRETATDIDRIFAPEP